MTLPPQATSRERTSREPESRGAEQNPTSGAPSPVVASLRGLDYDAQVQRLATDPTPPRSSGPAIVQAKAATAPVQKRDYQDKATTSKDEVVLDMDELETAVAAKLGGADSLDTVVKELQTLATPAGLANAVKGQKKYAEKSPKDIEGEVASACPAMAELASAVLGFKKVVAATGRSAVHEIAGFKKAWGDLVGFLGRGMTPDKFAVLAKKQLEAVQKELASKPEIGVEGGTTKGAPKVDAPKKKDAMSEVEKTYDVLARKSAPPPDDKNNVSEVDLAFLSPMRGFPDVYASVDTSGKKLDLSKANEEKVFSVGSAGALGFKGELSDKAGARFYGVLMPKGWVAKYGEELRERVPKKGGEKDEKRSARAPNGTELANKGFRDDETDVTVGKDKAFGIRAEESTKEHGQVDVHRDRMVDLTGSGEKMSQLEFFRQSSQGVVEFDDKGLIINLRMW
ncbi:MAG: hypothetical protein KC635_07490 [Myxococcales bacterium]|nr:hypothetical protein [Myxococcales bacterium]